MSYDISLAEACKRIGVEEFGNTPLAKALERLPQVSPTGPWIAGGAVRRTLMREALDSDFDFFFKTEEQLKTFQHDLEEQGASKISSNDKNQMYILPSKVVTDGDRNTHLPELRIQLIYFRYYDSPAEVIDSFDFTLCQFAYDGKKLVVGDFALFDAAKKRLVPGTITYATASLRRLLKYTSQGYTVCSGGLADILQQVAGKPEIIEPSVLYID